MVRVWCAFYFLMSNQDTVNFLKPKDDLPANTLNKSGTSTNLEVSPVRVRRLQPGLTVRAKLVLFGFAILATGSFLLATGITSTASTEQTENLSFLASLKRLVAAGDKPITGQNNDRVNFLLLGIGGSGHDGAELTDTIIFGSLQPSSQAVGLLSIPRDLNVDVANYGYRKINNVNAFAESEKRGSGPQATAAVVADILNQEVHYTIKVDFSGFEKIINDLGGIDVYVEREFTDTTYPLDDSLGGVEIINFTQGWTHMDGETALKFARSRHGSGSEGSDFARAARQQKILLAVKDKALSLGVLLNPAKLNRILNTIQNNVDTNLTLWEMIRFAKYIPDITSDNIAMHVLDNRSGLLYDGNYNGAYVLLPYEEDWSELQALAQNIFAPTIATPSSVTTTRVAAPNLQVSVEIQNGTATTGLASQTAQLLESSGFTVTTVGNAVDRATPLTIIYDLSDGKKDVELAILKDYLKAQVYMSTQGYLAAQAVVPDLVLPQSPGLELVTSKQDIDFLIILGQDSTNLVLR